MKKPLLQYVVLLTAGAVILFVIPRFSRMPAGCLFQKITGFHCAGCGFSRAVHALLKGNIERSMHQNILLLAVLPAAGFWLAWRYFNRKYSPGKNTHDTAFIAAFLIIVILFTVLRNTPLECFAFLRPV
jgi:hypothetical protein